MKNGKTPTAKETKTEATTAPKVRRKAIKVVKDETLVKLIERLRGEDKKKANKVRRSLMLIPQERLIALGATPEELGTIPEHISRTFLFGTRGRMFSGGTKVHVGGDIEAYPHQRDMRATHEYYNMLVRASQPLFDKIHELLDGPKQQQVRKVTTRIDEEYAALRLINQAARKREDSPEALKHMETITKLKAERKPLFLEANKERRSALRTKAKEVDAIKDEITAAVCACRQPDMRPGRIWHGNYTAAERDFGIARAKAINDGIKPHLHGEYKGEAESFMTNKRWDGAGLISANISGSSKAELQSWAAVLEGRNPHLHVRPLTPSDLVDHGMHPEFRIKDTHFLVSIRRGYNEDISYVSAPVVLHRQPKPDDKVSLASFITRKEGLKLVTMFVMACKIMAEVPQGNRKVTVVPDWTGETENGAPVAYYTDGSATKLLTIPDRVERHQVEETLEHSKELHKTISNHLAAINTLRKEVYGLEPEFRGNLRYIGRPDSDLLIPRPGIDRYAALSRVAEEMRDAVKLAGHFAGGKEGNAKAFVDMAYTKLLRYFIFRDKPQGINFTTAWMFRTTYQHLYPWAVSQQSRALKYRRERYRIFASQVLADASELHIPDTDYRTRFMSDAQKLAAPSELLDALKNYASKHGITVFLEDETGLRANLNLASGGVLPSEAATTVDASELGAA